MPSLTSPSTDITATPNVNPPENSISLREGRAFWGKGIATLALRQFLQIVPTRPIYARAASDNRASIRVLEKCGFRLVSESLGFANARGCQIPEVLMALIA